MIRTTLLTFALAACLGTGLFKVKYAVQGEEQKLVAIRQQIAADEGAIHVLKAEWSAETQPQQLGERAERDLALAPITAAQLGSFDKLPMRPNTQQPQIMAEATPIIAAVQPASSAAPAAARTVVATASDAATDAVLQAMQAGAAGSHAGTAP